MPRIVSIWLARWPIVRFLAHQAKHSLAAPPVDPDRPFVLTMPSSGGPRITAANRTAESCGVAVGESLADARAKAEGLQVRDAEPEIDAQALERLARWATRYTPNVATFDAESGADGLFLDITGSTHLFGSETDLLADIARCLARFGLDVRLAVAGTAGAAWALAHFHPSAQVVLAPGRETTALTALPIAALRLDAETCTALRRLGLKRIGMLLDKPRAPLAARFERQLLQRLDQALGRLAEPLAWVETPPTHYALRHLLEPIGTQEAVIIVAKRLMQDLLPGLERDGMGIRRLRLVLYRVDGETCRVEVGFTLATRSPSHVVRLLSLELERVGAAQAAGFGFEALGLIVTRAESLAERQDDLVAAAITTTAPECRAALVDTLAQRLGRRSLRRLAPVASHLPEKAETARDAAAEIPAWPMPDRTRARPPLLFPEPEPMDVTALVPDGPPRRFRWRGVLHDIIHCQGPERIAAEWWRNRQPQPTRDYYDVEDAAGRRFWIFREGLYGRETAAPRWYVHGLFA